MLKLATLLALLLSLAGPARAADALPPHPRLLLNAAAVAQVKLRVQITTWSNYWNEFKATFDRTLTNAIDLPPRGGNWTHWYACPTHSTTLYQGKRIGPWEWEHICPVDKEILHGDPTRPDRDFDGVVINRIHNQYSRAIRDAGLLYQVTGDKRYAQRGRAILLAYADRYLTYPLHDKYGAPKIGGGRIGPQTLDEAVWLVAAAQGADLIWDTLTEADRQILADKLFLPAARDVILPHKIGIHNIQCWKNSAVGLVGFLVWEKTLIHAAIDDPDEGFRAQLAKGLQPDGVWSEGSWAYHWYALNALWPLAEAARNCGTDLYTESGEPLRKMFAAPLNFAMPNLALPAFNDSNEVGVRSSLYELAYARYHDPQYLTALVGANRMNENALLFGVDQLPAAPQETLASHNAPDSGYAILQRGIGIQATWLCLKYGPHGGEHGHFDKNHFILYTRGQVICPDAGTRLYGLPLHAEWDKVTLAHNTLAVDETSQLPATGKCLAFGTDHGVDYAMTDAGEFYKGVRFIRTAALLSTNLVLFVDQIDADQSHTFDLICHHNGRWQPVPAGEPWTTTAKNGYQHLRDATTRRTATGLTLGLEIKEGWPTAIVLAGNEPTEVITATGVGKSVTDRIPVAIFRRTAKQTCYVWAVSLDAAPVTLSVKTVTGPDRAVTVAVTGPSGKWDLLVNPTKSLVQIKSKRD